MANDALTVEKTSLIPASAQWDSGSFALAALYFKVFFILLFGAAPVQFPNLDQYSTSIHPSVKKKSSSLQNLG